MSNNNRLRITGYNDKAQCWVVQTPEGHIFAECPETVYSEGYERAKRLVDSVNAHDRLVEALRKLESIASLANGHYPFDDDDSFLDAKHDIDQARALLAELDAKGEK